MKLIIFFILIISIAKNIQIGKAQDGKDTTVDCITIIETASTTVTLESAQEMPAEDSTAEESSLKESTPSEETDETATEVSERNLKVTTSPYDNQTIKTLIQEILDKIEKDLLDEAQKINTQIPSIPSVAIFEKLVQNIRREVGRFLRDFRKHLRRALTPLNIFKKVIEKIREAFLETAKEAKLLAPSMFVRNIFQKVKEIISHLMESAQKNHAAQPAPNITQILQEVINKIRNDFNANSKLTSITNLFKKAADIIKKDITDFTRNSSMIVDMLEKTILNMKKNLTDFMKESEKIFEEVLNTIQTKITNSAKKINTSITSAFQEISYKIETDVINPVVDRIRRPPFPIHHSNKRKILNPEFNLDEEWLEFCPDQTLPCSEEGYFRLNQSCTKFYRCYFNELCQKIISTPIYTCPHCLKFNAKRGKCDLPKNVPECTPFSTKNKQENYCTGNGNFSVAYDCYKYYDCNEETENGNIKLVIKSCPASTVFDQIEKVCTEEEEKCTIYTPLCKSPITTIGDKYDCRKFYHCTSNNVPILFQCPKGSIFNGYYCDPTDSLDLSK